MADFFQFTNNATTTLASSAAPSDTSLTLATGTGALFPNLTSGEIFTLTLNDAATGLIEEICYCTARTGDVLTVMRAQEGTTALSWAVGALASLFPTAATYASFVQAPYVQLQPGNFAEDTGSANAAIITLDPAITSWTQLYGAPIRVLKMGSPNASGAYTINANGIGPVNVVLSSGANPPAGALPAHCIFEVIASPYSGDLQLMSVAGIGGAAGGVLSGNYPNPGFANAPPDTFLANTSGIAAPPGWAPLTALGASPGQYGLFAMTVLPSGWQICDGSSHPTTGATAALFAAIGYTYGGSGSNFNVPDWITNSPFGRGYNASGPSGALGALVQDAMQGHVHYGGVGVTTGAPLPFVYGGTATDVPGSSGSTVHTDSNTVQEQDITSQPKSDGTHGTPRIGSETHPVNQAWVVGIHL